MTNRAALLVGLSLLMGGAGAAEPRNLDLLKRELRAYQANGDYERDIARVAEQARTWIEERAARRRPGERLAVVIDLDETLISNWPEFAAMDFGYVPSRWTEWVDKGEAPAIEPVRAVYRLARKHEVAVLIITARTERDRAGTEKNLRAIGCDDYAALVFQAADAHERAVDYKTRERRRLSEAGFTIIANLGDQESDLAGGFAERTFKLPCPFYLTE